jgi:hypothetical protein
MANNISKIKAIRSESCQQLADAFNKWKEEMGDTIQVHDVWYLKCQLADHAYVCMIHYKEV